MILNVYSALDQEYTLEFKLHETCLHLITGRNISSQPDIEGYVLTMYNITIPASGIASLFQSPKINMTSNFIPLGKVIPAERPKLSRSEVSIERQEIITEVLSERPTGKIDLRRTIITSNTVDEEETDK